MRIMNMKDLEDFISLLLKTVPFDELPSKLVLEDHCYDAISPSKSSKDVSSLSIFVFAVPGGDIKIVSRYQYEFEKAVNARLMKLASEQRVKEIVHKRKKEDPYWGL